MPKALKVTLKDDPERIKGRVLDFDKKSQEVQVLWEDLKQKEWVPIEELKLHEKARPNPPQFMAPEIQDLEVVSRIDRDTGKVIPVRDHEYDPAVPGPQIRSSEDIYELFKDMGYLDQEHLVVGSLDVRNHLTGWKVVHKGHLASVEASPRKMLQEPWSSNAASFFMIHNHPSSFTDPSEADEELTAHMVEVGNMMEIPMFDHLVIGRDHEGGHPYFSFRDAGLLPDFN